MADVLTPAQRRLNMRRIRAKNTAPELQVRRGLHARGLRFRLHRRDLPGCPDIVFPSRRVALFVHGCFWHSHDCELFRLPMNNRPFWQRKLARNKANDDAAVLALRQQEWRVLVVWECALRGRRKHDLPKLLADIDRFIHGTREFKVIEGTARR